MTGLILKRASIGSNQEDYDVVAHDKVVGRIFLAAHSPRHRLEVDLSLRRARRPKPDARLRTDTRGRDAGFRQELAPRDVRPKRIGGR